MKPACYNREPFTDPSAGWVDTQESRMFDGAVVIRDRVMAGVGVPVDSIEQLERIKSKRICRYRWPWFTDRCEAWNPGPGHVRDTVPAREGWACDGCKHLPAHARAWIRGEDGDE